MSLVVAGGFFSLLLFIFTVPSFYFSSNVKIKLFNSCENVNVEIGIHSINNQRIITLKHSKWKTIKFHQINSFQAILLLLVNILFQMLQHSIKHSNHNTEPLVQSITTITGRWTQISRILFTFIYGLFWWCYCFQPNVCDFLSVFPVSLQTNLEIKFNIKHRIEMIEVMITNQFQRFQTKL